MIEYFYNSYSYTRSCGYYRDPVKECSYTAMAIARYQKKISGPLLDRIDIHVEVPRVDYEKLAGKRNVEDSKTICARMQAARERQLERSRRTKLICNAEMGSTEVREFCQTDTSGEKLLKTAVQQLHLSAGVSPVAEANVIIKRTKTSAEEQNERIPALRIHDHRSTSDSGATRCRQ